MFHPDQSLLSDELIQRVVFQFALSRQGIHGPMHWGRVMENGLRLADETGANKNIVSLFALLNYNLRDKRPIYVRDDDPAYEFITAIHLTGKCLYPDERAGDEYKLTLRGHELHAGQNSATLSDFHAHDENRIPIYRTYRGEEYPVYKGPPGLSLLNRQRGTKVWDAWLCLAPRLVSDMLHLINTRPLYVAIHEKKTGRDRWIQSISLQTKNPDEDE